MRSGRLLSLLLLLQARERATAPALAAELGVSVRTVYRDVEALSAAGVPVWAEQGYGGGIRIMPGYRTDVSGLTAAESRALVALTGRALPHDLGLGEALASAVHKLVAAVPASHRDAAERARQRVLVDHTGWYRTPPAAPLLAVVQDAVWADRRLAARYRHGDGRTAQYRLDPLGLVVKAGTWYLVAAAAPDRDPRLFRVDRLLAAEPLPEAADRPPDLDLEQVWDRLRAGVERPPDAVAVRLLARPAAAGMLVRLAAGRGIAQVTGPDGADPPGPPGPDGRVELHLRVRALGAARGLLAGFGADVEVLSPVQLRADLLRTARALLALYADAEADADAETEAGVTRSPSGAAATAPPATAAAPTGPPTSPAAPTAGR